MDDVYVTYTLNGLSPPSQRAVLQAVQLATDAIHQINADAIVSKPEHFDAPPLDQEFSTVELVSALTSSIGLVAIGDARNVIYDIGITLSAGIPVCFLGDEETSFILPSNPRVHTLLPVANVSNAYRGVTDWYQELLNRRRNLRDEFSAEVLGLSELRILEALVAELVVAVWENTWQLEAERLAEVDLLVKGLGLQLHSPSPRRSIIRATLRVLGDLLVGVTGNLLAAKLQGF